jgi:hypothetical protein
MNEVKQQKVRLTTSFTLGDEGINNVNREEAAEWAEKLRIAIVEEAIEEMRREDFKIEEDLKRAAIATTYDGWVTIVFWRHPDDSLELRGSKNQTDIHSWGLIPLPDYFGSLDEIEKVVKKLTNEQRIEWSKNVITISGIDYGEDADNINIDNVSVMLIPVSKRAEALYMMTPKYKEKQK